MREAATICPDPCKLTFDLLTLKVLFESRVTWATSVPILVFLGLCSRLDVSDWHHVCGARLVADVRDRQTDVRQSSDAHHRLMPPTLGAGHNNKLCGRPPQYAPTPAS